MEDDSGVLHLVGVSPPAKRQRLGIIQGQVRRRSGEKLRGDTDAATWQVVEKDESSKTLEKLNEDRPSLCSRNTSSSRKTRKLKQNR